MKKRLFLTGASGSGKSTALEAALGDRLRRAGGFRTVRRRDAGGTVLSFLIRSCDGRRERVFLDFSREKPLDPEAFRTLGAALLREAPAHPFAVLDEIGGTELLDDGFRRALEAFLESGVPCIGVMKGPGPAAMMTQRMGLGEEYEDRRRALEAQLRSDPDTLLIEPERLSPEEVRRLLDRWVEEYAHE